MIIGRRGTLTLTDSALENNSADGCGGITWSDGNVSIERVTFEANRDTALLLLTTTATLSDVKINSHGGTFGLIYARDSHLTATNLTITDSEGIDAGGIYLERSSGSVISDSTLSGNTSDQRGGGILLESTTDVQLTRVSFQFNSAAAGGGGVYADAASSLTARDCNFSGNSPEDVQFAGVSYDWGEDVSFTCETTCEAD